MQLGLSNDGRGYSIQMRSAVCRMQKRIEGRTLHNNSSTDRLEVSAACGEIRTPGGHPQFQHPPRELGRTITTRLGSCLFPSPDQVPLLRSAVKNVMFGDRNRGSKCARLSPTSVSTKKLGTRIV